MNGSMWQIRLQSSAWSNTRSRSSSASERPRSEHEYSILNAPSWDKALLAAKAGEFGPGVKTSGFYKVAFSRTYAVCTVNALARKKRTLQHSSCATYKGSIALDKVEDPLKSSLYAHMDDMTAYDLSTTLWALAQFGLLDRAMCTRALLRWDKVAHNFKPAYLAMALRALTEPSGWTMDRKQGNRLERSRMSMITEGDTAQLVVTVASTASAQIADMDSRTLLTLTSAIGTSRDTYGLLEPVLGGQIFSELTSRLDILTAHDTASAMWYMRHGIAPSASKNPETTARASAFLAACGRKLCKVSLNQLSGKQLAQILSVVISYKMMIGRESELQDPWDIATEIVRSIEKRREHLDVRELSMVVSTLFPHHRVYEQSLRQIELSLIAAQDKMSRRQICNLAISAGKVQWHGHLLKELRAQIKAAIPLVSVYKLPGLARAYVKIGSRSAENDGWGAEVLQIIRSRLLGEKDISGEVVGKMIRAFTASGSSELKFLTELCHKCRDRRFESMPVDEVSMILNGFVAHGLQSSNLEENKDAARIVKALRDNVASRCDQPGLKFVPIRTMPELLWAWSHLWPEDGHTASRFVPAILDGRDSAQRREHPFQAPELLKLITALSTLQIDTNWLKPYVHTTPTHGYSVEDSVKLANAALMDPTGDNLLLDFAIAVNVSLAKHNGDGVTNSLKRLLSKLSTKSKTDEASQTADWDQPVVRRGSVHAANSSFFSCNTLAEDGKSHQDHLQEWEQYIAAISVDKSVKDRVERALRRFPAPKPNPSDRSAGAERHPLIPI
eukprot:Clim_evm31s239 gene=Clim_evmTU31s239